MVILKKIVNFKKAYLLFKRSVLALMVAFLGCTAASAEPYETHQKLQAGDLQLAYRTFAGETRVGGPNGDLKGSSKDNSKDRTEAAIFSFGYFKKGGGNTDKRPVTFLFNGGPGSASLWLHIAGFGPKRVILPPKVLPPYEVVDNQDSLLDVSDLVFIDPVGTGYSRPIGSGKKSSFWGIVPDAKSIALFIVKWLDDNGRHNSPIYILGESYGTLRATLVADELLRVHNQNTDGLILLSAVQNYRNVRYADGSILGYVSAFPTLAATAWHHKLTPETSDTFDAFIKSATAFASDEYATALIAGNRLSESEKKAIAVKMNSYTGLGSHYLLNQKLRVKPLVFLQKALANSGQKLSRLDGRIYGADDTNKNARHNQKRYGADPLEATIKSPISVAHRNYMRLFLKIAPQHDLYKTSARGSRRWHWNWNVWGTDNIPSGGRYINVIPNLQRTLETNSNMRVLVTSGYYDFATPFFSADNAFAELTTGHGRVQKKYYHAGHMIYLDDTARATLANDIRSFINAKAGQ